MIQTKPPKKRQRRPCKVCKTDLNQWGEDRKIFCPDCAKARKDTFIQCAGKCERKNQLRLMTLVSLFFEPSAKGGKKYSLYYCSACFSSLLAKARGAFDLQQGEIAKTDNRRLRQESETRRRLKMPRKLPAIMFFILIFLGFSDDVKSEYQSTRDSVIGLHVREADNGVKNVFWYECGKKLNRKESEVRASEYANAIMLSVEDVYRKTGEFINPDHVVAVLFRESSHNTCVIGKKESDLLLKKMKEIDESAVLKKDDFSVYVKKWEQEKIAAEKWCTSKGLRGSADCIDKMIAERVPEYSGIHAWDIGVAQFRYPGTRLFKRGVVLPNGKFIDKITVSDLLDYDVSIQLLVEDLAFFKKECRNHEHWLTSERGDKIRKLDVEEAYFVHHHTGVKSWSSKYWYAIEGHLSRINKMKEILSSVLSSVLFPIRMFG